MGEAVSLHKVFILRTDAHAQALYAFLKANREACALAGKPLQIEISEEKDKRSLQQNKRYWAVLRTISETGWIHGKQFTSEAWHEYMKRKFIGCIDLPDGSVVSMSSAKLGVEGFQIFMQEVEAFAATELGVEFLEGAA